MPDLWVTIVASLGLSFTLNGLKTGFKFFSESSLSSSTGLSSLSLHIGLVHVGSLQEHMDTSIVGALGLFCDGWCRAVSCIASCILIVPGLPGDPGAPAIPRDPRIPIGPILPGGPGGPEGPGGPGQSIFIFFGGGVGFVGAGVAVGAGVVLSAENNSQD